MDNRHVHVEPSTDWCGWTDVTVRATDPGELWDNDSFRVAVTWSCQGPLDVPDQVALRDEAITIDLTAYEPGGGDEGPPLHWYAIACQLSEQGVATKGDKDPRIAKRRGRGQWSKSGVARILHSEADAGVWYYGKAKRVDGKQVTNPREHWLAVEVPAIVDRDLWEMAQSRLQHNKDISKRRTTHKYLLRRLLTCGECGARMQALACGGGKNGVYLYYSCPARYNPDFVQRCSQRSFRADRVDGVVWKRRQNYG